MTTKNRSVRILAALGFAILAALYSGCQAANTHGSTDPYYEFDGMWCGNYGVDFGGARLAVIGALTELKMPIYQQGLFRHGTFIDTRTPENFEARIVIMPAGRHMPGTRIGVRVGGFGTHREVCERLLSEIGRHLDVNRPMTAMPVPVTPPPGPMPTPAPAMSGPPQAQGPGASLPPQPVPVQR